MKIKWLIILIITFGVSCKHKRQTTPDKFDKEKWAYSEGKQFPYRDNIIIDLLSSRILIGLKQKEVLSVLGQPSRTDINYFFYIVDQQTIGNYFPLHTKTLVIKFTADTVTWTKVHE
ncbi:hypothetical protein BH09BAC2_BH09BAC2_04740 [soil metagenome]